MRTPDSFALDAIVIDGLSRGTARTPANDQFAAPFKEGGKARSIVELSHRLHLPALFIDRQGLVFLTSKETAEYLARDVAIVDGQIRLAADTATDLLEEAISRAVCAMEPVPTQRAFKLQGGSALYATVIDYPNRSDFQLLKVIVVLGRTAGEHREEIATLVKALESA